MANIKKNISDSEKMETFETQNSELQNKTDDIVLQKDKEIQEKDEKINELCNELAELKKMFESVISTQQTQIQNNVVKSEEDIIPNTVYIGSNIMGKTVVVIDKFREIGLDGYKGAIPFSQEDATKIVNDKRYRKLFERGLLYFEDSKWYRHFRIGNNVILSDDYIISMLKSSTTELINKLNIITENKTNSSVKHSILFRIAYLLKNNMIQNMDMNNFTAINDYFGVNISTTMKQLEWLA